MVRSRDDLRVYQDKSVDWAKDRDGVGLLLDMGLGKTVIVETALSELFEEATLTAPVLVVGPIRVIKFVWRQEAVKWAHTAHLQFSLVYGSPAQRLRALLRPAHIYLINAHNIDWLFGGPAVSKLGKMIDEVDLEFHSHRLLDVPAPSLYKVMRLKFGALVVDESSMFKNQGTNRFKALRTVVPEIPRRMILTGTPRPNSLAEMWSQAFIIDGGRRLGTSFYRFRERFFMRSDQDGYTWEPRTGADTYVTKLLQDIMLRLDTKDWLEVPPTLYNKVEEELPPDAMELYKEFEREMIIQLRESGAEVTALNMGVLSMKTQQVANGAIFYDDEESLRTKKRKWERIHDAKLEALQEVVDEAGGTVMVCYHFKHDLVRLREAYPDAPVFTEVKNLDKLYDEVAEGKHDVLLYHTASASHGIDGLQRGCSRICFFSLTWSNENHDQVIARIAGARQIGYADHIIAHYIIAKGTVDEVIMESNDTKARGQRTTLDIFRNYTQALEMME